MWAGAAIAALEARSEEAAGGFRAALGALRVMRQDFELARTALDQVVLFGPAHPDVPAAAKEARGIFERLGALPYLERLDAAISALRISAPAVETVKAR